MSTGKCRPRGSQLATNCELIASRILSTALSPNRRKSCCRRGRPRRPAARRPVRSARELSFPVIFRSGFERALLGVAEFAGARDLGLRKSQPRVELLFELLGDSPQEMHPPVIDQHCDQIAHVLFNPFVLTIASSSRFCSAATRRILPHPPQVRAFGQQACDLTQSARGCARHRDAR